MKKRVFSIMLYMLTIALLSTVWIGTAQALEVEPVVSATSESVSSLSTGGTTPEVLRFVVGESQVENASSVILLSSPIISDDSSHVFIPMRLVEDLGMVLTWHNDTKEITVQQGQVEVRNVIGSTLYVINGVVRRYPVASRIYNGRTYIPVRAFLEQFGYLVTENVLEAVAIRPVSSIADQIAFTCTPDQLTASENRAVSISYPSQATMRQYRTGVGPWQDYIGPVTVADEVTVFAQAVDETGVLYTGKIAVSDIIESQQQVRLDIGQVYSTSPAVFADEWGNVYVPIQYISDSLPVDAMSVGDRITFVQGDTELTSIVGSTTIVVNGAAHALTTSLRLVDGEVCVPAKQILEHFGYSCLEDSTGVTISYETSLAPANNYLLEGFVLDGQDDYLVPSAIVSLYSTETETKLCLAKSMDGRFVFDLPQAGQYKLRVDLPVGNLSNTVWYGGQSWADAAVITSTTTTPVMIQVQDLAGITCRVLDVNGVPQAGIDVYIENVDTRQLVSSGRADANGQYSALVPLGSYRVCAIYRDGDYYAEVFSPGTVYYTQAEVLAVQYLHEEYQTTINMPQLTRVNGFISDYAGTPLNWQQIFAETDGSGLRIFTRTKPDGSFVLFLPTNSYRIGANILSDLGRTEIWLPGVSGRSNTTLFTVDTGFLSDSLSIQVPQLHSVSGSLLGIDSASWANANVDARNAVTGEMVAVSVIDAAGKYQMQLPIGQYIIGGYLPAVDRQFWYPGTLDAGQAVAVDVSQPTTGLDIEFSTISLPQVSMPVGTRFKVPITVSKIEGLLAADLRIGYDPTSLRPLSVQLGSLPVGFLVESNLDTPGEIAIALAGSIPVSGTGDLALVELEVLAGAAGTSALTIAQAFFNDGAITVTAVNGSFTVVNEFSVSGKVSYYLGNLPVDGVTLQLRGNQAYDAVTDTMGNYQLPAAAGGVYSLTPVKADGIDGISAYDASLILQSAVGKLALTQEQRLAADADSSGIINAMDASYVLRQAAGLISLPFPNTTSVWTFVPANRSLELNSDYTGQDFTAILIGDVSGSWGRQELASALGTSSSVKLQLGTRRASAGEIFSLPLLVTTNGDGLYSADLVIKYDPTVITKVELVQSSEPDGFSIISNDTVSGQLVVAMASGTPLTGDAELIQLNLHTSSTSGQRSLLELVRADINENPALEILDGQVIVALPGDADLNNAVDIMDLSLVSNQYGLGDAEVDMNNDGVIDLYDLVIVSRRLAQ